MEDLRKEYCQECQKEKASRYCDNCGKETSSRFEVNIFETVVVRESLGIKQKRPGIKGWLRDIFQGFKKSVDIPDGVELYRNFDKENDQYDEIVKNDKTKEIVHECHEPLSEHVGHGSAKLKE